jgi:hypothetical protein
MSPAATVTYAATCPLCARTIEFPEELAETEISCPICRGTIALPQVTKPPPRMEGETHRGRKKSKLLASILVAVLGPFGWFYCGWRFGLNSCLSFCPYLATLMSFEYVNWPLAAVGSLRTWGYIAAALFGLAATQLVEWRNEVATRGEAQDTRKAAVALIAIYSAVLFCMYGIAGFVLGGKALFAGRPVLALLGFVGVAWPALLAQGIFWLLSLLLWWVVYGIGHLLNKMWCALANKPQPSPLMSP